MMKGGKTATMLGFVPFPAQVPGLPSDGGREGNEGHGRIRGAGRAGDAVLSAGPAVDPRSARFKAMTETNSCWKWCASAAGSNRRR